MQIGEFFRFVSDFKVPIKRETVIEIFRKTVDKIDLMSFNDFVICFNTISTKVNEEKMEKIKKNIVKIKNELNAIKASGIEKHKENEDDEEKLNVFRKIFQEQKEEEKEIDKNKIKENEGINYLFNH